MYLPSHFSWSNLPSCITNGLADPPRTSVGGWPRTTRYSSCVARRDKVHLGYPHLLYWLNPGINRLVASQNCYCDIWGTHLGQQFFFFFLNWQIISWAEWIVMRSLARCLRKCPLTSREFDTSGLRCFGPTKRTSVLSEFHRRMLWVIQDSLQLTANLIGDDSFSNWNHSSKFTITKWLLFNILLLNYFKLQPLQSCTQTLNSISNE